MSRVRVHNFSISLDGYGTGEGQTRELHFGHAGERLHDWMFDTRWGRAMIGQPGGGRGVDDVFTRQHERNIGAEIMGAGKFGHPGWEDDPDWKGAWGPNPPFHSPVFVLTHHTRPSIEMEGGTTYHFLDASPEDALATAREAAGGKDVRLVGVRRSFASSSPPGSSTTRTSSSSRSSSAAACGCGTAASRASSATTRSSRSRRRAASRT